jgi:hypothetical protein
MSVIKPRTKLRSMPDCGLSGSMKDKIKTGGEAFKGLIKTGGDVMDKALDKSSDVATLMVNSVTGLISKMSDDIGVMADRILTMEERIGLMADRMVHTEKLMAKLTATLADKDLDLSFESPTFKGAHQPPVLVVPTTKLSQESVPELMLAGDHAAYLLYVSSSPLFRDGATVVSRIEDTDDFPVSWKRSIEAIKGMEQQGAERKSETIVVAVAVKTISDAVEISPLSNSIDVTVYRGET